MPVGVTIKTRRGTAAEWSAANPTLAAGEPGYETDTGILKYGDGVTAYNSLPARVPTSQKTTRSATIVIAASNSSAKSKAQADYVCDGIADNVEIQAALDALPVTGGEIKLLEGTYTLAATVTRAIDNVTISGTGYSTYIQNDQSTPLISFGGQSMWVLQDMRLDYGGFDYSASNDWYIQNLWVASQTGTDLHIDKWGSDHIYTPTEDNIQPLLENHPLMVLLDDFEDEGWTIGTGTLTYDTTIFHSGTKSMKVVTTPGGTSNCYKIFSTPVDLVDAGFSFWVYTPDYTKISSIVLSIKADGEWVDGKVATDRTDYLAISSQNNRWWRFNVSHLVVQNDADISATTEIRLAITAASGQVATVYIDGLHYWKNGVLFPNGVVSIDWDDGHPSVPTFIKPLTDKYKVACNWGIIQKYLNDQTIKNAKTMQSSGWDIVSHGLNHDNVTSLSKPEYEFLLSQKLLAERGFRNGSKYLILPYGVHNEKSMDVAETAFSFTRSTKPGYNSLPGASSILRSYALGNNQAQSVYKNYIDTAKKYKIWLSLFGHMATSSTESEDTINQTNMEYILNYCKSVGIEILTYSQIRDRIISAATHAETSGSGTIASGSTSVDIRHGFHKAPTSIQITPTSALGAASSIWVSSKDTGTGNLFTVSVDADPGADVTFDWRAVL